MSLPQSLNEWKTGAAVTVLAVILAALYWIGKPAANKPSSAASKRKRSKKQMQAQTQTQPAQTQQTLTSRNNATAASKSVKKPANNSSTTETTSKIPAQQNPPSASLLSEDPPSDSGVSTTNNKPAQKKRRKNANSKSAATATSTTSSPSTNTDSSSKRTPKKASTKTRRTPVSGRWAAIEELMDNDDEPDAGRDSVAADDSSKDKSTSQGPIEYVEPEEGWSQVRRIKPGRQQSTDKSSVNSASLSQSEANLTKLQRQNRRKAEEAKALRHEAELERLETLAAYRNERHREQQQQRQVFV